MCVLSMYTASWIVRRLKFSVRRYKILYFQKIYIFGNIIRRQTIRAIKQFSRGSYIDSPGTISDAAFMHSSLSWNFCSRRPFARDIPARKLCQLLCLQARLATGLSICLYTPMPILWLYTASSRHSGGISVWLLPRVSFLRRVWTFASRGTNEARSSNPVPWNII